MVDLTITSRESLLRPSVAKRSRVKISIYEALQGITIQDDGGWKMGDPRNGLDVWGRFRDRCGAFANSDTFQNTMSFLIIVNAVLLGVMTFDFVRSNQVLRKQLEAFDLSILGVFTVDFVLQFIYLGKDIVHNMWLVFDGILVVTSWSILHSSVNGLRTLRNFRIFALCGRLDALKHVMHAVYDSIPSMAAVWMILGMIFYVFAILFTGLYRDLYNEGFLDRDYFGRLDRTLVTLFQMMTMDWVGIAREVEDAKPSSFLLLFGFVAITGFFMVNLAIAVVCQSLIERKRDASANDKQVWEEEDQTNELKARIRNVGPVIDPDEQRFQDKMREAMYEFKAEVRQLDLRETLEAILARLPPPK